MRREGPAHLLRRHAERGVQKRRVMCSRGKRPAAGLPPTMNTPPGGNQHQRHQKNNTGPFFHFFTGGGNPSAVRIPCFASLNLSAKTDATAIPIVTTLTTDQISLVRCTRMIGLYTAAVMPRTQTQP